jgi:hypothetical protein
MAQAMPVMMLTQAFNRDEIPVIKIQQTFEKMEIPVIDGCTVEANLYGLNEFFEAVEELTFDTGDELFCAFRKVQHDTIKQDWDTVVNDHGFSNIVGRTAAQFDICICAWKLTFVTKDSRQTLIDYSESVRKPQTMTVEVFVQCLKTLARYVEALPHIDPVNAPILSADHLKYIVYKAMATQWQVQFIRTHHGIALVAKLHGH